MLPLLLALLLSGCHKTGEVCQSKACRNCQCAIITAHIAGPAVAVMLSMRLDGSGDSHGTPASIQFSIPSGPATLVMA